MYPKNGSWFALGTLLLKFALDAPRSILELQFIKHDGFEFTTISMLVCCCDSYPDVNESGVLPLITEKNLETVTHNITRTHAAGITSQPPREFFTSNPPHNYLDDKEIIV